MGIISAIHTTTKQKRKVHHNKFLRLARRASGDGLCSYIDGLIVKPPHSIHTTLLTKPLLSDRAAVMTIQTQDSSTSTKSAHCAPFSPVSPISFSTSKSGWASLSKVLKSRTSALFGRVLLAAMCSFKGRLVWKKSSIPVWASVHQLTACKYNSQSGHTLPVSDQPLQ